MSQNKSILKYISTLLIFLLAVSLFFQGSGYRSCPAEKITTEQKQQDTKQTTISEKVSLDAIVSVGVHIDFHKIVFVIPQMQVFAPFTRVVKTPAAVAPSLLTYFVNLFTAYIVVNAP